MKRPSLLLFIICLFFSSRAQVAINSDGSAPEASAILDLKSTSSGLLLPRMSTEQMLDIPTPVPGLMIFNTDSSNFYGYSGNHWISMWGPADTITPWLCGNIIIDTRDGNEYSTVLIGDQCWMAENLRASQLTDGTTLTYGGAANAWINATGPLYCYFDNVAAYGLEYGYLYNYYAANTGMLCKEGWHVPENSEWDELAVAIGGTGFGYKLKEAGTSHWLSSSYPGTNESGYTALGAGIRYGVNGTFEDLKIYANFWSTTNNGSTATWYYLWYWNGLLNSGQSGYRYGHSIRCVMD
jgi:uncharacterized protein (TIGR02145 family)